MSERLFTPREAADFLKLPSLGAFYKFRRRHGIPNRGLGRSLRFFEQDLVRYRVVDALPSLKQMGEMGRMFARGESIDHLIHGRRASH